MSTEATHVQSGQDEFGWFVGLDWGTKEHVLEVGDAVGQLVAKQTVKHTSTDLARFADWLGALTDGHFERVAVAIEVPRGAIVELLLERGAAVFAVNPKQLDRFRDRFSVAGAKDDRLDARVMRSSLRTDRERFHRLTCDDPMVIRIRELTRAGDVLQQEFQALANRLRELVHRIAPEWLTLSPNADDRWFWTLLEWAATPALGRRLRRRKLQGLLKDHRIRRVTVDEVFDVLERPPLTVAPGTVEAVTAHIQLLLPRVRLADEQLRECERELTSVLEGLAGEDGAPPTPAGTPATTDAGGSTAAGPGTPPSDVAILQSVPGLGIKGLAAFLAEAWALLMARDYYHLRCVTGVAPVRRQTGVKKRGVISMRYACNLRLRNACYHMANVSMQHDEAASQYYAKLRARGHSHGRALRSVADRWLRILIAMLTTRTLYNPTRFTVASNGV